MPPVTRKTERVMNGQPGGEQKWTGMSMNCPVNICPMCKRVVDKLHDHKSGQIRMKICARCKGKF